MKSPVSFWDCVCEKCGNSWATRSENVPKMCPGCKSTKWDEAGEIGEKQFKVIAPLIAEKGASQTIAQPIQTLHSVSNEPAIAQDWDGWSEERQAPDYDAGETVTYRQHLKTGKKKEIRRESAY